MVRCTRCAFEIDEEPLPQRCPQCGQALADDPAEEVAPAPSARPSFVPELAAEVGTGAGPTGPKSGPPSVEHGAVEAAVAGGVGRRAVERSSSSSPAVSGVILGGLRLGNQPVARPLPAQSGADLPIPVADEGAAGAPPSTAPDPGGTHEFEVQESECEGSGVLDLPHPKKLGESAAILARARHSSAAHTRSASTGTGRARPMTRSPWLLVGLIALGLASSLAAHYWAKASDESTRAVQASDGVIDRYLSEDTPDAYAEALMLCVKIGDRACQAEVLLLRDLRYGPDRVHVRRARVLLRQLDEGGAGGRGSPSEARARALSALRRGELAKAEELLVGEEWRTRLVRGWVAAAGGREAEALAIAEALLEERPGDPAAALLMVENDPAAGVDALLRLGDAFPEHPRIQEALVAALIEEGELLEAERRVRRLRPSTRSSASFRGGALLLRGELLERRGLPSQALELYDEAAEHAPDRPEISARRFRLLLATGDHARLRGELEEFAGAAPPEVVAIAVELDLRSGLSRVAAEGVDKLTARGEGDGWVPYLQGLIAREQGEVGEALAEFASARELVPAFTPAIIAEAEFLHELGRLGDALVLLRSQRAWSDERSGRRRLLRAEVDALISEGRGSEALEVLDLALAEDPGDNDARTRRGVLRVERGLVDEGRDDLLRVEERAGVVADLIAPLGRLYLREGALDRASALIEGRLEDRRAAADIVLLAGEIAFAAGDLTRSEALARRYLLRQPEDGWRGALLQARIYEAKGELSEAAEAIASVRPPRPDPDVELVAGRIYEANGAVEEALTRYRRAHHYEPSPEHELRLARALLANDAVAEAVSALEPMVEGSQGPDGAHALLAEALVATGELRQAQAVVEARLERVAGDVSARYWLGRILDERRRREPAIAALEQALGGVEGEPVWLDDALRRLVRALEEGGELERAAPYRERLVQRDADESDDPRDADESDEADDGSLR